MHTPNTDIHIHRHHTVCSRACMYCTIQTQTYTPMYAFTFLLIVEDTENFTSCHVRYRVLS